MNGPLWAFKAIGFPKTPVGDLALLVLTHNARSSGDDLASGLIGGMGLRPFTTVFEDLLQPLAGWSAAVEGGDVVVGYNGQEMYRPMPGIVPAAWTRMAVATSRIVLVFFPGQDKPDTQQLLVLLRAGEGLWGAVPLT